MRGDAGRRSRLQRGRTCLSAEIVIISRCRTNLINASTGPHLFECGDVKGTAKKGKRGALLQRGRTCLSAEINASTVRKGPEFWLQRGRTCLSAEIGQFSSPLRADFQRFNGAALV